MPDLEKISEIPIDGGSRDQLQLWVLEALSGGLAPSGILHDALFAGDGNPVAPPPPIFRPGCLT